MQTPRVVGIFLAAGLGLAGCPESEEDLCDPSPCFPGVDCSVENGAATCGNCPTGSTGDGMTCTVIKMDDPCDPSPCFAGVDCTGDTAGNYTCGDCPAGYEGDGETCTDVDGCLSDPCFAGVECTDVVAPGEGFTCGACPAGTEGDGETCTDIDGCAGDPCFPGTICTDVAAPDLGYACGDCPVGYEGDGEICSDVDGCANDPCFAGVICTDVAAPGTGFECGDCTSGLEGDGVDCTEIDGCAGDPCLPTTTCTDVPAPGVDFTCTECMGAGCPILTAQAGPDAVIVAGQVLTLMGSATGFNGLFTCAWANDQDASMLTTCSATVSPTVDTLYTLTVTDASGQMASDDKLVTLAPLTADAGIDINILQGETATITASWAGASCMDTSCIQCEWALTDGTPIASTCTTTVAPSFTSAYVLTVTDTGTNDTATDSVSVYVTDANANVCGWNVVVMRASGFPTNGNPNYICDANGDARRQTVNGRPAIVLSDLVVSNTQIIGHIGVETTSDDDLIGIIWGWQNPQHMYLLKWKQSDQSVGCGLGMAGIGVTKVDGSTLADTGVTFDAAIGFPTTDHTYTCAMVWSNDRNASNLLDPGASYLHSPRDVGASRVGWADNTTYRIELFYTPTRTKVMVYEDDMMTGSTDNLVNEFVVQDSSYPQGQFAFYSASQEQVVFGDFTIAGLGGYFADAGPDQTVTMTSSVATLIGTAQFAVPPYTCEWSDGVSMVSGACTTDVIPAQTTTYDLMVTDDFGRVATDSMTVTVQP